MTDRSRPVLAALSCAIALFASCTRDCSDAPAAPVHADARPAAVTKTMTSGDDVDDDIQAARKMLAAGDESNAITTFDAIRESLPAGERQDAVACELAVLLNNRATHTIDVDARAAEKDARRAVQVCPGDVRFTQNLARLLLVRAQREDTSTEDGRQRARGFLDDAVRVDAHNTRAQRMLGEACALDDDFAGALEHLRAAYAIEPTDALHKRIDELAKKAAVEGDFTDRAHAHFVARFEGSKEEDLAWRVLDVLEKTYLDVGERLDVYPRDPIVVVIYTGDQYKRAVDAPDWSIGLFDGKIRVREGNIARGDLERLLRHEYVHALLASLGRPIPAWFHEGLAMNLEPVGAVDAVKPTFDYDALTKSFVALDQRSAHVAYVVSANLVRAVVAEGGGRGDRLRDLLARMQRGDSFDDAFASAFGVTPRSFFDRWATAQ